MVSRYSSYANDFYHFQTKCIRGGIPLERVKSAPPVDQQLMELEMELEGLKSLLTKNETYGNKLRSSLAKTQTRLDSNRAKLKSLLAQQEQIETKAKANRSASSYQAALASQQQLSLHGHRIQGILFYEFEKYWQLDCIQAFQLMSRKKAFSASLIPTTTSRVSQCFFAQNNIRMYFSDEQHKLVSEFFNAISKAQARNGTLVAAGTTEQSTGKKLKKQQKQQQQQQQQMIHESSLLGNVGCSTTCQIDVLKKEVIKFAIRNLFDQVLRFQGNQEDNSHLKMTGSILSQQSSITPKGTSEELLADFFSRVTASNIPIFYYIDWIIFAHFLNALCSDFSKVSFGHIDAIEVFSEFKYIFNDLGSHFFQTIQQNSGVASSSSTSNLIRATEMNAALTIPVTSSASIWQPQDDERLMKAVSVFGEKRWGQVSTQLNGKEHTDIVQRWVKYLNPKIEKGRWSLLEDVCLAILYEYYQQDQTSSQMHMPSASKTESKTWCLIAEHFSNRTEVQIRERWCNLLDPKMKFTQWKTQEDSSLIDLALEYEGQWAKISRHLENKTDNQVLRRWKLLLSDRYNVNLIKGVNVSVTAKVKKPIFKLVKLPPPLAAKIRKDNDKRRQKKKLKKAAKKLGSSTQSQKPSKLNFAEQHGIIGSSSQIDNTSTFRSSFEDEIEREDDDDDDNDNDSDNSGIEFTDYQSNMQIDTPSSCFSEQQSRLPAL